MEIVRRDLENVTVLELSGRLTADDGSGRLKEQVTGLIASGRKQIVLNLARLTYMDSSGLGEMVACYGTAVRADGKVAIAHATTRIKDLLTITKLVTVFDAYDTEPAAVASFGSQG